MTTEPQLEWVECPRDALQGLHHWVPTHVKVAYLNALLQVGFDVLDFGSFVSPKAIPQWRDTAEIIPQLDRSGSHTRLLAIVLNERGAADALAFPEVDLLGFPLSLSETFSLRNGNQSLKQAQEVLQRILERAAAANRQVVVYFSMGFGNPYGDPWSPETVLEYADRVQRWGVQTLALADTVGNAEAQTLRQVFGQAVASQPHLQWGVHLHTPPAQWHEKVEAAWQAGCRRFDTALGGFGGCPFAQDDLVGNLATENLMDFLHRRGTPVGRFKPEALQEAQQWAMRIFSGNISS